MGSVCVKPHTSVLSENRRKTSEFTEALLSATQSVTGDPSPGCFSKPRRSRANKKSETSKSERSRRHLIAELIKREERYGHSLDQLEQHFITPLCAVSSPILTQEQAMKTFSNLGALVAFSRLFLERLKSTRNVSEVFWEFVQYLQNFQYYVQQYHISLQTIDSLQGSQSFQEYLDAVRNEYQLELMALLLAPIEQFCTYARFLDLLSELTPPKHKEFSKLQDVLQSYAEVTAELEEVKEAVVNMTTILAVQNRMKGEFDSFVRPDRVFLCDGLLDQVNDSNIRKFNSRIVFLFSNLLIWSTDTYKFKGSVDLSRKSLEAHRHPQSGEVLGIEVQLRTSRVVFLFRDAEQREIWLEALGKTVSLKQASSPHTSPSLRSAHQVSPPSAPRPAPAAPSARHSISHYSSPTPSSPPPSSLVPPGALPQHHRSRTAVHQRSSSLQVSSHTQSPQQIVTSRSGSRSRSRATSPVSDWSHVSGSDRDSSFHLDDDQLLDPTSSSSHHRPAVAQDVSSVPASMRNSRRASSHIHGGHVSQRSSRATDTDDDELRRHSFHDGAAGVQAVTIRQKLLADRHGPSPRGSLSSNEQHSVGSAASSGSYAASIGGYQTHGAATRKRQQSAMPHTRGSGNGGRERMYSAFV